MKAKRKPLKEKLSTQEFHFWHGSMKSSVDRFANQVSKACETVF